MLREELSRSLAEISDIERLTGKVASQAANARDVVALKSSLKYLAGIKSALKKCSSGEIEKVKNLDEPAEVIDLIEKAIESDPPHTLTEGGLIKKGFNEELDKLKDMTKGNKEWISELEIKERQRTGNQIIESRFHFCVWILHRSIKGESCFRSGGLHQEADAGQLRKVHYSFAQGKRSPHIERRRKDAGPGISDIHRCAQAGISVHVQRTSADRRGLAELDVLLSFATVAAERKYVRPAIKDKCGISIIKRATSRSGGDPGREHVRSE